LREPTESGRLMREAGERASEYILELHTKIIILRVGCDGVPKRYIGRSIGFCGSFFQSRTYEGAECEFCVNKGGNTWE